ncbi:MAG: YciI family protein [Cucumibacter sp.]
MRFMMIVKSTPETEADVLPSSELIAAMGRYNEELIKAGTLLAGEGLKSSRNGARIKYAGGKFKITDGPFTETKELIAGFWIIEVKSKDEALAWVRRIPFEEGQEIELREVFEAEDFAVDAISEEHLAKEAAWRKENQKPLKG